MGGATKPGFTIIETMLFLAITGLLIISLLGGAGASINTQRYQDSVTTLQSNIQQLYSNAVDVTNDRSASLTCDTNAQVTSGNGPSTPVGQSDCVLIGQYMTIQGSDIATSSIVGYLADDGTNYGSDIAQLQAYQLSIIPGSTVNSQLDWGASIAWPSKGTDAHSPTTPRTIAIFIAHSPTSGLTYTFTSDSIPTNLETMVVAGDTVPGQAQQRLCINSNGLFNGGLAVVINEDASNFNDIQVRSNDMGDASTC